MIKLKRIIEMANTYDILNKSSEEIIDLLGSNADGFTSKKDAIEYLDWFKKEKFPVGLSAIPSTMILYRVLLINDGKKINEKKLGKHFVSNKEILSTRDFLEDIGILDWMDSESTLWCLTCKVSKSNLDLYEAINNRLMYPNEEEFTLKYERDIIITNKKQLDISDYV